MISSGDKVDLQAGCRLQGEESLPAAKLADTTSHTRAGYLRHLLAFDMACQSAIPQKTFPCEVAESMFVPKLLDQVRVKERPEVFMVFRLDRAKQTADLFCLDPEIIERGVLWTMLEDAWDDRGQPGSFCKLLQPRPVSGAPFYSSFPKNIPGEVAES